ncbi:PEP-CTERM sorting domain-containing protein [Rubritalea marina]|uniref:PEP-CTERM sorting domain-containing protein n=1 Tax=Rubritalea marina TaxID=361055 RepID=UPI0014616CDA|nr:PEP-CTERM sorting domain-containing protein [Rubritalea marina]
MKYTSLVTLAMASSAYASTIIAPTGVILNTSGTVLNPIIDTINGSGFDNGDELLLETGDAVPGSLPGHYYIYNTGYRQFNDATATIVFDLGGSFNVESVILYNYAEAGSSPNRGINTVDIEFSTDGGLNYTSTQATTFSQGVISGTDVLGENVSLASTVNDVTHVRFSDMVNFGGTNSNITGFQEIRFVGTAAVPEPSSTALLGLAGLGLLALRKRHS